MTTVSAGQVPPVDRQIVLPMRRAVEIAYKNIRLRLGRSLLVTSSIVLSLAFLVSILVNQVMQESMRQWIDTVDRSPRFAQLRQQRDALEGQLTDAAAAVRAASPTPATGAGASKRSGGKSSEDAGPAAGADLSRWLSMGKSVGSLPLSPQQMDETERASDPGRSAVEAWARVAGQFGAVRQELDGPQALRGMMVKDGLPSTPAEVANDRLQRRWLVGMALLVAFIGIVNAMLMSVTERFREIGTMKCLGALDGFIIRLFLIESSMQAIVGTVLGIVAGEAMSLAMLTVSYGRMAWQNPPVGALLGSALLCLAVGLVLTIGGGLYPAWQAARLQPIAAMRADV